jgi:hypothetical protein
MTAGDAGSGNLSVTWVEGEPGSEQYRHAHDAEQVYVVVAGKGIMHVDGEEKLVFVTAASPPFEAELVASLYEPPHSSGAT